MANQISKISKKVTEWVELSGYDIEKVKENMKSNSFAVEKLSKKEAKEEGCDMNYPYRLFNPYNLSVK
jgi:ribulose 1,5-bisphosphate carboxylase large subunit-like protein